MNVETLIEILQQIPDKKLLVRVSISMPPTMDGADLPNYWLDSVFVHNKGDSGYEENGEVNLWGHE